MGGVLDTKTSTGLGQGALRATDACDARRGTGSHGAGRDQQRQRGVATDLGISLGRRARTS
jgi:hypothetical protein